MCCRSLLHKDERQIMDGTWRLVCSKMLCWSAEGLARLAGGASPTDNYVLEVFSSRGMSDGGRVLHDNIFSSTTKKSEYDVLACE